MSRRRERQNWARDKKYEVFQGVTAAARTMLWRGDEIDASRVDATLAVQRDKVRDAMRTLRDQLSAVALLTKGEVVKAADEVEGHFGNEVYPHFFAVNQGAEPAAIVSEARRLLVNFQEAARRDLDKT